MPILTDDRRDDARITEDEGRTTTAAAAAAATTIVVNADEMMSGVAHAPHVMQAIMTDRMGAPKLKLWPFGNGIGMGFSGETKVPFPVRSDERQYRVNGISLLQP